MNNPIRKRLSALGVGDEIRDIGEILGISHQIITNRRMDEMSIDDIYKYAKEHNMNGLVEAIDKCNTIGSDAFINIKSEHEAILAHALLHRWMENMAVTSWDENHIATEHDRVVDQLNRIGITHNIPREEVNERITTIGKEFKTIMHEQAKVTGDMLQNIDEKLYGRSILLFLDKYFNITG